jgi:hypothetical protein
VSQGSVLLSTADIPTSPDTTTTTFADDTAVLTTDSDPAIASHKLQTGLLAIKKWLKTWHMKASGTKSTHITFTTSRETCPPVHINNILLPQTEKIKDCILTAGLPGATSSSPNESNSASYSPKCTGCSDAGVSSLQAANSSPIKSY